MTSNTDPKWKFNEGVLMDEIHEYISKTYSEHYAGKTEGDLQTFELIAKSSRLERGFHFATGSMMKYADRTPLKAGNERKDLLKAIHFGYLALYCFDKMKAAEAAETEKTEQ